ncbi:hypothetical protein QZH47_21805 [Pseudomonas corrugata]
MSNRIAGLDLADVEQQLSKHFRDFLDNEIRMKQVRNAFHQDGYFHFKDFSFLPGEMWEELHTEVHGLLDEYSAGHEATVLFIHDPHRKVHMIPQAQIAEGAAVVPALYHSESLRHFLSCIADEELASCPDSGQYLISRLNHPDDTHDWHWGDYPYTLVWIIEAPEGPERAAMYCNACPTVMGTRMTCTSGSTAWATPARPVTTSGVMCISSSPVPRCIIWCQFSETPRASFSVPVGWWLRPAKRCSVDKY